MIVYAQTQWKEHALGADRWKIIHTLELPHRLFHHFRCNLNENYDFIAEHAEEMYVDRNRMTRGMLVLCEGSEDGILVNSEGSSYARYSAYLPGARTLMMMDRHPSLAKFCEQMGKLVDEYAQKIVEQQKDGQFQLPWNEVDTIPAPEGFTMQLFTEMLAERPEIEGVEETGSEIILTVAQPYLRQDEPGQSAEQSM